jgi:hypothetical protein
LYYYIFRYDFLPSCFQYYYYEHTSLFITLGDHNITHIPETQQNITTVPETPQKELSTVSPQQKETTPLNETGLNSTERGTSTVTTPSNDKSQSKGTKINTE